jgi:signal transduction histidine kinase/DNA-binding response OmpR family regulator/ligand-binding sensor domain-containing protein
MITQRLHSKILLAMLFVTQLSIAQSQYRFQHYSTKDGLADDYAHSLKQDSLGFIWTQYYGGISRFDGHSFKVYRHDTEDPRRSSLDFLIGRLLVDKSKNIWVTQHHHKPPFTIARYDRKLDGFRKFTADLNLETTNQYRTDHDGRTLWLNMKEGKGLQTLDLETGERKTYLNPSPNADFHKRQNTIFDSEDQGSSILVATERGLWSFDKITKTFCRPTCNAKDSTLLFHTPIGYIGPKDRFWIIIPGAMLKLGPDLSILQRFDFSPEFYFIAHAIGQDGILWFGHWNQGLYRVDPSDGSITNIRNVPTDPHSLNSNAVNDIFVDQDRNVWIANAKGISRLLPQNMTFRNKDLEVGGFMIHNANDKDFLIISRDNQKTLLKDIIFAPLDSAHIDHLQFQELLSVKSADFPWFYKGKNHFWISTRANGSGIYRLSVNPTSGMIERGTPFQFRHDPDNPNTISSDDVGGMWEDPDGNLWVGNEGLCKINSNVSYGEKGSVTKYKYSPTDSNAIGIHRPAQIYPEDENSFWLLGPGGIELFHHNTQQVDHIFKNRETARTLYKNSDGTVFLGTVKGLYKATKIEGQYQFGSTPIWNKAEVTAIQEDRLGRLWLYSRIGPVCYDPKENIAIEFNESDGVSHAKGIERGYLQQTSKGLMILADPSGLSVFDPLTLIIDRQSVKPVLTSLKVNNQTPKVGIRKNGTNDFYASKDISVLDELMIDYQHNNFAIEFSSMEMKAPEKNLYRHKLEGFDNDWIETNFRDRTATYTNLDAGEYTFRVKASNHHGIWSDEETTLKIKVLPPPWKSTKAYTAYSILFIGLLYAARKNIVQRERLKSNLKLAKVEQEKEHFELEKAKEVDKVKSTFFANISHEFRTPLTLIKGPVQELLEEFTDHPKVKDRLTLVQRNADLVLKLINQLLDLAKLESGTLTVEKSESDLNAFLRVVTNSFSSLAFQKNITLETELPQQRNLVSFDKGKVETILINLINNAIKFTPPGGSVVLRTELKNLQATNESHSAGTPLWRRGVGGEVIITVSDTGIGIPLDQQTKVFERFHQVSEAHKEVGTGIGLSLVKELVALMNGTLSLKSEPSKGSEFRVILPVEVIRELTEPVEVLDLKEQFAPQAFIPKENGHDSEGSTRPRILVVEDNGDLRRFIIDSLGTEFHFLEAGDGKQGMDTAIAETPDLIISDVMMPEMDGITMTGILKKDTRTSHIPLILLTAKTSDESKLSGLSTGADDYLTKPFNKNELLLKVRNSIALRVKLREKLKLELLKESPNIEVQSADEKFLLKVRDAILSRLSDEQLSVESLADEIGLSRSQLFRKISALTGASVNELIRTFRLQRAAQLIEQDWGPVTQVAYEVGYSNLSYFSKAFKEKYGVLPSEYGAKTK